MKTIVTIEYYNAPEPENKRPGSIKANDTYYKFWEDFADIACLKKGATVEIAYKVEQRGKYENNMLEAARPVGDSTSNAPQNSPVNNATSPVDERTAMMLTSYAKDLMCHGIAKTTTEAVGYVLGIKGLIESHAAAEQGSGEEYDPFAE